MKLTKTALLFLLSIFVVFISCGSDDDDILISEFKGSYTSVNTVEYLESAKPPIIIQGEQVSIDDMFKGYAYTKPIVNSELDYNKSYIRITGLTDNGIILTNFTVSVNGISKNLGTVNADYSWATKDILDYLNTTLESIVVRQNMNVEMTFSSNKGIRDTENVKLILNYDGVFQYIR